MAGRITVARVLAAFEHLGVKPAAAGFYVPGPDGGLAVCGITAVTLAETGERRLALRGEYEPGFAWGWDGNGYAGFNGTFAQGMRDGQRAHAAVRAWWRNRRRRQKKQPRPILKVVRRGAGVLTLAKAAA